MNYRHGFHAGNHTEPLKHAVLLLLIDLLKGKDKPFAVFDTHAGMGMHDLRSEMALRTREAEEGIGRLMTCAEPALAGYLDLVRGIGGDTPVAYPGSPEIIRRSLRPQDRLVACELHPEDAVKLRALMKRDSRVHVHSRDGYEAALALIPPPERRGLVFVDPPFEHKEEAAHLGAFLSRASRKWPTGTFAAWYPVKSEAVGATIVQKALDGPARNVVSARFCLHPRGLGTLAGGTIIVLNAPWHAEERMSEVCLALRDGFGGGEWAVDVLRAA